MPLIRRKGNLKMNMIKSLINITHKHHVLAMVLCCAIPMIGILALSWMGVLGSWGYIALILICPLGHVFMMRAMHAPTEDARPISIPEQADNQ